MQSQDIVKELRGKKSRDNRDLLDRAADEIERLRKKLKEQEKCDSTI